MKIQHNGTSNEGQLDLNGDEITRKYYKNKLKISQDRSNLPRYTGPEYGSMLKTIERYSLITHLIFLYGQKKISKKEYEHFSLLGNASILEHMRRKRLLADLDV